MRVAKDYVGRGLLIFTILLTMFAVVMVLWKLLGNSPTLEQLTFSLLMVMAAWLFSLTYKQGIFEGRYIQLDANMKDSFVRVREDLSEIRKELGELRQSRR